jgi:predicted outer membrane repeat protein
VVHVPADAVTIQAGIDMAVSGDTVLVADGLYTGDGNRDIDFGGKSITLLSEGGPLTTTIDCRSTESSPHFAFTGVSGMGRIVIDGFSIARTHAAQGSVLNLKSASPIMRNCVLTDNTATVSGGAIRCKDSSPAFVNCTFFGNASPVGGTVYLIADSEPTFTNCIIAFSTSGGAIGSHGANSPLLECCNLFGNVGGDWTGVIASLADSNGNLSLDPLLCLDGDFRLEPDSPCLPVNNSCGVVIGATDSICH